MKINIVCLLIVITLICQNISCLLKRSKKNREAEFFTSYNILSPYLYTYELKQLLKEKIIEYNSFCNTYLAYIKQNAYYIYLKFNSEQLDEILNDVINNNGQKSKSVKEVIINCQQCGEKTISLHDLLYKLERDKEKLNNMCEIHFLKYQKLCQKCKKRIFGHAMSEESIFSSK